MKPTLVDYCEHYNRTTHICDKCSRGLPDVCLEFEEMRKKASSFDTMQASSDQTQRATKPRGRQRKQIDGENTTD